MPSGQGQGARVALSACAYVYTPFAEPSPCHTQAREAGTRHRVEAMAGRAAAIPRYLNCRVCPDDLELIVIFYSLIE